MDLSKPGTKTCLLLGCVCVGFGVCIGYGLAKGGIQEQGSESKVEIQKEIVTVFRTVVEEKKEEQRQAKTEKERIVVRQIAVPCNCKDVPKEGKEENQPFVYTGSEGTGEYILDASGLTGYFILSERIEEREKKEEEETKKVEKKEESEGKKEEMLQVNEEKKEKIKREIDWLVGIRVGYDFMDKREKYGVDAHRRIAGPFWVGVGADIRHDLNVSADLKLSVGF